MSNLDGVDPVGPTGDSHPTSSPSVTTWKDFSNISELFNHDEEGNLVFDRTTFMLSRDDGTVYYGSLKVPKKQITLEQARDSLQKVPDQDIYPPLPQDILVLTSGGSGCKADTYIKRPKLLSYHLFAGQRILADRFLEEARNLQLVHQHPHPNVAEFRGCIVNNDRIIGLVLKRFALDLASRLGGEPLDRQACFQSIKAGLDHLHQLGLAHNDINPHNIMMDSDDKPVIIDLGSCKPIGQVLTELGTPGWNDGFDEVSSIRNDYIGLKKMAEWLGISYEGDGIIEKKKD